jgi:hypothetical protein
MAACSTAEKKQNETKTTQQVVTSNPSENTNDWTILFDGSSFDHWRGYLSDEMFPEWAIVDSAMVFTPGKEEGKNIISRKKYTNFILSLEWKISEVGNSGIFWGVYEDKRFSEAYMTGPEIQVLDNERHPDSFVGNGIHKAGSLYDMIGCPDEHINPAGKWNKCVLEIDHKKNIGTVTMNGKASISFPLSGEKWNTMVANSKFKDWEGFGKYPYGYIGLQDHSDKVWFKNIKIKEI